MIPSETEHFTELSTTVAAALAEDLGSGDITASLVDEKTRARGRVITTESGVVCGRPWFDEVFRQLDSGVSLRWHCAEGDAVQPGQLLVELDGAARPILTGERTALNFLQTLSGTAAKARQFADLGRRAGVRVLDTRKTLPGLRRAQKYAVRVGGCENHRMGLYDAFLIKENHIAAAGSIARAVAGARQIAPGAPIEVETENLQEVAEALTAGADRIMLDNFDAGLTRAAVELIAGRAEIEVSGGLTLDNLDMGRLQGVDFISSGSLTKDVRALDLSMRVELIR